MKKHIVRLVDDLDGGEATETVRFGLDGVNYEIDVSAANAKGLRDKVAPYVMAGRLHRSGLRNAARTSGRRRTDRGENAAIRHWAAKAGKEIASKGRIPRDVADEYRASGGRLPRGGKAAAPAVPQATFQAPTSAGADAKPLKKSATKAATSGRR